ncbi:MAG: apolipoprotein N-acyltransferase [Firmicutes bacterium]|nr:apolipoprotein N-acyltransferase [Bacillota bacterium]
MKEKGSFKKSVLLCLIALLCGVLAALSLPPINLWIMPFISVAILFFILSYSSMSKNRAFFIGFSFAVGQFILGLLWANYFTAVGYLVLVVVESLFFGVAGWLATVPGKYRSLTLPAFFCLAEYARDHWPFGGLPIGSLALGQTNDWLINLARLGGPILIVFFVYLVASYAAFLCKTLLLHRANSKTEPRQLLLSLLFLATLTGVITFSIFAPDGGKPTHYIKVAAIQGGGARGLGNTPTNLAKKRVFDVTLAETKKVPLSSAVRILLWPEDTVSVNSGIDTSSLTPEVSGQALRLHAVLIAGFVAPDGPKHFYNKLVAFSPEGKIVAEFEKVHLVPFGEYIPDRSFFAKFANLSAVPKDAVSGHGSGMIKTPFGKLALLISYETFFTHRGRSGVMAGGQILFVATNTASYASAQVPSQELSASKIQAVSEGRSLLQAATTGYSAAVTPRGSVTELSQLGRQTVIYARLGYRTQYTLYDDTGSAPTVIIAIVMASLAILFSYKKKRTLVSWVD